MSDEEFEDITDQVLQSSPPPQEDEFEDITEAVVSAAPKDGSAFDFNNLKIPTAKEALETFNNLPDSVSRGMKQLVNPEEKWFDKYKEQGINLNLATPETQNQIAALKKSQKMWQDAVNIPKNVASGALDVVDSVFQPLRGAVAGLAARMNEPQEELLNTWDFSKAMDLFLDPKIIREKRNEWIAAGEFSDIPLWGTLQRLRFELAPPIEMEDVLGESTNNDIEAAMRGLEPVVGEGGVKFLRKVGTSLAADPATYMTLGARATNMAGKSAKVGGFAEEIAAGDRAFLTMKVPFKQEPFFTYKGLQEAELFDELKSTLQARLGIGKNVRMLSQRTGMPLADDTITAMNIDIGERALQANRYLEMNKALGGNDPLVANVARMMREHGDEQGILLAKKMGLKVSDDAITKSEELNKFYENIRIEGNKLHAEAGLDDMSNIKWEVPSVDEQQAYEEYLHATKGIDVPRILVTNDQGVTYDLTYSRRYDGGRSVKDQVKEAKRIDESLRVSDADLNRAGLGGTKVSSQKPRSRLSTEAMESVMSQKGIKGGAYNQNYGDVIISKYLEKAAAARNAKFADRMADMYGVLPGQEELAIIGAQNRVRLAKASGKVPSYEDQVIAQLKPDDFIAPNVKGFDKLRFLKPAGEGGAILKAEQMKFPKAIALKMDQVLLGAQPTKSKILAAAEWWQNQWSKNVLTNGLRVTKQFADNLGRVSAVNAIPEMITQMNPLRKADHIDDLAKSLPSISSNTIWDMKDFKGPITVSSKMLSDKNVNNTYYSFINSLKEASKKGEDFWLKIQGGVKKVGKAGKTIIEFPNDNIVAKKLRDIGNSADVVSRKALFRKYINQGYTVKDAVKLVNENLMDFENTSQGVRNIRFVSPFAAFHMKNMETLPRLIAQNPVLVKTFDTDDGYLKKAWNDVNGWSVDDYKLLNKMLPFYRSQYIGPVMRGGKELLENASYVRKGYEKMFYAGLNEKQREKAKGMVVSFDVPNFIQASTDFADMGSALQSPLAQGLMAGFGINPFNGQRVSEDPRDNIRNALAAVNPYQYPKLYNKVILPLVDKIQPKMAEALRQGPWSADMEKIFKLQFGKDAMARAKLDENTIRELTNMKFMGLARADAHDMNYYYQQTGLMMSMDKILQDSGGPGSLMTKLTKGDTEDVKRTVARLFNIVDDIKFNTKVYRDFKRRFELVKTQMTPDEAEALDKMIVSDDAAPEQEPVEMPENEGEEFDVEEESFDDGASLQQSQDRMPAGITDPATVNVDESGKIDLRFYGQQNDALSSMYQEDIGQPNPGEKFTPEQRALIEREVMRQVKDFNKQNYRNPPPPAPEVGGPELDRKLYEAYDKKPREPAQARMLKDQSSQTGKIPDGVGGGGAAAAIGAAAMMLGSRQPMLPQVDKPLTPQEEKEYRRQLRELEPKKLDEVPPSRWKTEEEERRRRVYEYQNPRNGNVSFEVNLPEHGFVQYVNGDLRVPFGDRYKSIKEILSNKALPEDAVKTFQDIQKSFDEYMGAQDTEMNNSRDSEKQRLYKTMLPSQLGEQVDSKEKQDEILRRFGSDQIALEDYKGSHTWSDLDRVYSTMSAKELKKYPPSLQREYALGGKGYGEIEKVFENIDGVKDVSIKFGGRWLLDSNNEPIGRVWSQNKDSENSGFSAAKKLEDSGLLGKKYKIEATFYNKIIQNGKVYPGDAIGKGTYNTSDGYWKGIHKQAAKGGYSDEVSSIGGSMPYVTWTIKPVTDRKPQSLVEETGKRPDYEEPGPPKKDYSNFPDYDLFEGVPEMKEFWEALPDDKKPEALKLWLEHLRDKKRKKK